jgi:hypothetical protein
MNDKEVWLPVEIWGGIMEINEVWLGIADKYNVPYEAVREVAWVMFASYLDREKRRHMTDIVKINADLDALKEKGFSPEFIPADLWIKVP